MSGYSVHPNDLQLTRLYVRTCHIERVFIFSRLYINAGNSRVVQEIRVSIREGEGRDKMVVLNRYQSENST